MGVASHLNIPLDEYDARIRTFIPEYEQMLAAAADGLRALTAHAPAIVDLGIGTGALAARCLDVRPDAAVVGIDEDPGMLAAARARLAARGATAAFVQGSFLDVPIPACDAVMASLALHHVRDAAQKLELYRRARGGLRDEGLLISADAFPARDPVLAALDRDAWRAHMRRAYSAAETDAFFAAWAREDTYLPLEEELTMLRAAALAPDVVWRHGAFAVVVARAH